MAFQILRCVMLFPTIERMAQSPQGKIMTPLLCQLRYILYMPIYLATLLPERVKDSLVRFALRGLKNHDESSIMTSVDLVNMGCVGARAAQENGSNHDSEHILLLFHNPLGMAQKSPAN
ncbi:hypothetical protein lerEdw1_019240 [Lerista edwardsae]|nr:hypothetical protein lerEdw1_019240 [Lerista edwardsae]